MTKYNKDDVAKASLEYFKGDSLAADVFVKKYCLQDKEGNYYELTPDDMHKRLAKEFARIEKNYKNPLSEEDIYEQLKGFKKVIPQGSPMAGIGNDFGLMSLSNCVVVESPSDTISGIFETAKKIANLSKRRCGVGVDISTLRPEGSSVSNAAKTSSGAWSFADFYSLVVRSIGQSGRRGALIVTLDIAHEDVEKFISAKQDLKKITGANISVKITDEFMKAVVGDKEFTLKFPVDKKEEECLIVRKIRAKELWEKIVHLATTTAEPGILFWDRIVDYSPHGSYKEFQPYSVNPCGEVPLSVENCRLICICLKNYVKNSFTDKAEFDFASYCESVKIASRLADDLVDLELEKEQKIIDTTDNKEEKEMWQEFYDSGKRGRRFGLGTTGLADALACLGLAYDSEEALKVVDKIYKLLRNTAYETSAILAAERGAFLAFDWEKEKDNEFIKKLPQSIRDFMEKNGRRNICLLTNAPTGTVSIVAQVSSGIEPVFRNKYTRRRKLESGTDDAPDFTDALGDKWKEYAVYHHNVQEYINISGKEKLPSYFVEANTIKWENRVKLQGTIQKYIDHSISSTINLPAGTTEETVGQIYMMAWEEGLKGVTIYVEGSRDGVLISDEEKHKKNPFIETRPVKRPERLECDIHRAKVKGEDYMILVGKLDNKPYEVFAGLAENFEISEKYNKGFIEKRKWKTKLNRYDLCFGNESEIKIKDILKMFDNPNHGILTRMVSLGLRHGAAPNFIIEQMLREDDSDFNSFCKVMARTLKKYVPDGTMASGNERVCPECSLPLMYREGCLACTCGWSRC